MQPFAASIFSMKPRASRQPFQELVAAALVDPQEFGCAQRGRRDCTAKEWRLQSGATVHTGRPMHRQLVRFFIAAHMTVMAAATAGDSTTPPPAAAPHVAVLTPAEVVQILDQTSDWYRNLATQQQIASQPSDLLIVYANRQIADKVVALAFDMARANAELLSSEADAAQKSTDNSSLASVNQRRDQLDAQRRSIQQEMADERQKRTKGKTRKDSDAKLQELEGELAMNAARANLLDTMGEFVDHSNPKTADAQALKAHIDAIEASIPTAGNTVLSSPSGAAATPTANSPATTAAPNQNAEKPEVRHGIWDLAGNAFRLRSKIKAIEAIDEQTKDLADAFHKISEAPVAQLQAYSAKSDALASQADTAGSAALQGLRAQFDTLAWLFKETSSTLLPLGKQAVLLQQYRHNLSNWRDATRRQYREAVQVLAIRLSILIGLLAAVVIIAEIWRRAVHHYVHDPRRRYRLLLARTILMWAVIGTIMGLSLVSEISAFATFAGLITAGVAVAMQSVLVSVVGYFFLIGKYGIRVGDRVQVGAVVGEVMDLGLVRMHLIEYHEHEPRGPTGRVVAFPNLIVFQATAGLFRQIPGVSLSWHEITLPLPAVSDYTALKKQLLDEVSSIIEDYRGEIERQNREVQGMSVSPRGIEASASVQMHIVDGHMQAQIRYPVHSQHAAEIDERVSQAVLRVLSPH
jgi:small-conductance mechanosensitive channel